MTIKAKTQRVGKGEYVATIGDVRETGTSAIDAALKAERSALEALQWCTPVVECVPSAGLILVAYQNAGSFCYDVINTTTGQRQVSVSTGETFGECVASMRRHADHYALDAMSAS